MMDLDTKTAQGMTLSRRRFLGVGDALGGLIAAPSLTLASEKETVMLGQGVTQLRVRLGGTWLSQGVDYRVRGGRLSLAPSVLRRGDGELGLFYQDRAGSWHERRIRLGV